MAPFTSQVIVWDVLMFISIALLVMTIVPPLVSPYIGRRKTWYTLMFSMLFFAIGEILLVGQQTDHPNVALCLVQVGIIHSATTLLGAAMAAYTIDIYTSIRRMFMSDNWEDGSESKSEIVLVLIPWILLFLVFLETVLVAGFSHKPLSVATPAFYCRSEDNKPIIVTLILTLLAGVLVVGFQAATAWMLYKNWLQVKNMSITSTMRKYIYAFVRTIAFTVIVLVGISLAIATYATKNTEFAYVILIPFGPFCAAAIFGTYKDIMTFYVFWK